MNPIKKAWRAYIRWCDNMGLTREAKRCCMPNLQDPPLKRRSDKSTSDRV
ncbi:DUF5363 family protein [Paraferrimonas haliotis]|uniref:Uncharacterized protein n=1 Tax=Paraferrimonas haliotis TaxID=2013866 RepID=A0AA37TZ33_9GAMM|nr:DUF5363 family protein [Paraferrimonas haliotis]GLS83831.1 hypothetical protein GCM10007894_18080 [Paraferrimonas haliotis]GLS83958.1 hypothetical protein GCM10007894_19350 [Paraferrimonas haliotis]